MTMLDQITGQQWYGLPSEYYLAGAAFVAVFGLSVFAVSRYQSNSVEQHIDEMTSKPDKDPGPGHALKLEPPDLGDSLMGLLAVWRHEQKGKRLARKGYVKWYKIGAKRQRPRWVKPDYEGAGVPEYYDSDEDVTYVFPEEALVTDARTGAWVAEHRIGEAEPINLRDPAAPALDADRLEEVINLEAESDAPGFFDRLNIDQTTLMWILIFGAFGIFAAFRYMNGGA